MLQKLGAPPDTHQFNQMLTWETMRTVISTKALLLALLVSLAVPIEAAPNRSAAAVAAFKRANPCPATGGSKGKCPGYVVDHIEPLCAGGADAPSNMQWQTVAEAKVKDREEVRQCRKKPR